MRCTPEAQSRGIPEAKDMDSWVSEEVHLRRRRGNLRPRRGGIPDAQKMYAWGEGEEYLGLRRRSQGEILETQERNCLRPRKGISKA
jgi:hypothetical protein